MKIHIERGKLIDPLTHVIRSLGAKTLPILSQVKIVVCDNTVIITASDMQTEMTAVIENQENIPGECCVPGKRFFDVVKNAKSDSFLKIELKNNFLVLKQGRILQKLKTLSTTDFPTFDSVDADYNLIIESKVLLDMIQKVSPFMGKDDVRYYLNGIYMELNNDTLTLAATNGHRLSTIDHQIDYKQDEAIEIIIPNKSINEVVNILNEHEVVELLFARNKMQFKIDNLRLNVKLIDGRYPDFRRIIPAQSGITSSLIVNRYFMLDAIKRAIPIIRDEKTLEPATLSCSDDGSLKLHIANEQSEESDEFVDAELTGAEFTTSVNIHYLKDAFSVIDTKDVIFNYSSPSSGLLITPDDEHFNTVIMPVRK